LNLSRAPRPRRILLVFLLLATGALTVLGIHAFRQKLESFQPLGFEPVASSGSWLVRQVAASPPADLRAGDRIVLVNGVEAGRIDDLRSLLGAAAESQIVVLRGDRLESVAYQRPALDLDVPWIALALLGIVYLAIGLYTVWRTDEGNLFLLWCLASAVLYVFSPVFPVDRLGAWVYLGDELARIFLPPLTVHLFLSIPRTPATARRGRRSLLYAPAAALAAAQIDLVLFNGRLALGKPSADLLRGLDRLELVHLAVFAAAALAVLVRRLMATKDWEQHRQLLWLFVGTATGYLPFFLLYGFPFLGGLRPSESLTTLAVLPLAGVPLAFGWAILRYRLWDLGLIVRNGIAHALTILAGVGGFALFDLALRRSVPEHLSFVRDLASFFGGVAIIGIVIPAHRRIQGALERLHYGRVFHRRRGLAWLGQELLRERDLDRLCEALLAELEQSLELDRVNLFLVQKQDLVAVRPEGALPAIVAVDRLSPGVWSDRFETLSAIAFPGESTTVEQQLYVAGYRYLFPLVVREARVGLLLCGLSGGAQPLNSEDIDLVRVLLDQAALAIENAQLLDQVQRQLDQVGALQRHSEGILESSPAGIAVLEPDGSIVMANLAFAALAGRLRGELVGRQLSEVFALEALPRPGEGSIQTTGRDALGRLRALEVSLAAMLPASDGDRSVLVVQDVSDRVAMESALKEKDRLASLGVLAAGVAHEVNTPLTGISSYAQMLLAETDAGDPRRELLEKVEKQTFRASRIVSNLLEFARQPGKERKSVDVAKLIDETVDLLRERMSARHVRLDWRAPEKRARVSASEGELQQVVTNLVLNAIDAMSPAGGTLSVALDVGEAMVGILVTDEGPGIAPEHQASIFQPFFSTKRGQGGTGLGLSISYAIVEQHGGRLRFENLPRRGCRFSVELPLERLEASSAG
jgi:hypothetical protein